ncbi:energy transducer TonB family protein [Pacificimonas sp. ICDLI1SI03]
MTLFDVPADAAAPVPESTPTLEPEPQPPLLDVPAPPEIDSLLPDPAPQAFEVRPQFITPVQLIPQSGQALQLPREERIARIAARPEADSPEQVQSVSLSSEESVTWEARVLARINASKRYPKMMGSRRPEGIARVRMTVDRNGTVSALRVLESSGHNVLDNAAIATVRQAAPLPEIPADRNAPIEITVPVEFSLD